MSRASAGSGAQSQNYLQGPLYSIENVEITVDVFGFMQWAALVWSHLKRGWYVGALEHSQPSAA